MCVGFRRFSHLPFFSFAISYCLQYEWLSDAADQLATLAFYVWTAVSFRPHATNPYLKLQQSDDIEMS